MNDIHNAWVNLNVSPKYTSSSHTTLLFFKPYSCNTYDMPYADSPKRQALPTDLHFFVNDGLLSPDKVAPLKPTTLDTPMEEIRRRYKDDGYVFLKGLLPREDVLKARREYFELFSSSGVLVPGTEPVEGIFDSRIDKLDFPGIGAGNQELNGRPI